MNAATDHPPFAGEPAFIAALLHRLGSPVGALVNYLHLVEPERHDDPNLLEAWRGMQAAVEDLRATLEGARQWMGAVEDELDPTTAPVREVLDAACRAAPEGMRTTLAVEGSAEAAVCPLAVVPLLGEVLRNAAVSGAASSASLAARLADGRLLLTVEDDGVGWSANEARLAFDAFRRFSAGASRQRPGLGLTVVAATAGRLGGRAWGEALEGRGARVVVALPMQVEPPLVAPLADHNIHSSRT